MFFLSLKWLTSIEKWCDLYAFACHLAQWTIRNNQINTCCNKSFRLTDRTEPCKLLSIFLTLSKLISFFFEIPNNWKKVVILLWTATGVKVGTFSMSKSHLSCVTIKKWFIQNVKNYNIDLVSIFCVFRKYSFTVNFNSSFFFVYLFIQFSLSLPCSRCLRLLIIYDQVCLGILPNSNAHDNTLSLKHMKISHFHHHLIQMTNKLLNISPRESSKCVQMKIIVFIVINVCLFGFCSLRLGDLCMLLSNGTCVASNGQAAGIVKLWIHNLYASLCVIIVAWIFYYNKSRSASERAYHARRNYKINCWFLHFLFIIKNFSVNLYLERWIVFRYYIVIFI